MIATTENAIETVQTVSDALSYARAVLRSNGVETEALDARLLLAAALGTSREELVRESHKLLTDQEKSLFQQFLQRRLAHEPVSKILSQREFWGLAFQVSTKTLDPRPDSEIIIEVCLDYVITNGLHQAPLRVLDLGAGSGCLIGAILHELPNATGVAVDISEAALAIADKNFRALGLRSRVEPLCCDWALALSPGCFDIVVCNPPYIASADLSELQKEVRDFDPKIALDGGIDGFCAYRESIPQAFRALKTSGLMVFEAGFGQAAEIEALMKAQAGINQAGSNSVMDTKIFPDLSGIPRVVAGVRQLTADNP